jgi:hypothetical protein
MTQQDYDDSMQLVKRLIAEAEAESPRGFAPRELYRVKQYFIREKWNGFDDVKPGPWDQIQSVLD